MASAWIIFVIFLIATAAITFFVLKKAFKMAIRAMIVALILLIAVVGGVSLWMFSEKNAGVNNRPSNSSTKSVR